MVTFSFFCFLSEDSKQKENNDINWFSVGAKVFSYLSTPRCPECHRVLPSKDSVCPNCHPFIAQTKVIGGKIIDFGEDLAKEAAKEYIKSIINDFKDK